MKLFYLKLLFLTIIPLTSLIYSQQPTIEWQTFYAGPFDGMDSFKKMVIDNDGNNYVVSCTHGNISNYDRNIATFKVNSSGQIEWDNTFTGPGNHSQDYPIDIAYDPNGAVVVLGKTADSGIVAIKYNSIGGGEWVYYLENQDDEAYSLNVDNSGNVYIVGKTDDPAPNNYNALLVKLDANGSLVYRKEYIYGGLGTSRAAKFVNIKFDYNGDLILIGDCRRTNSGHHSLVVSKMNTGGSEEWFYTNLTDSSHMGAAFFQADIVVDNNNDIYCASSAGWGINGGYSNILTLKLNGSSGNLEWLNSIDAIGVDETDWVKSLKYNNDRVYLSSYSRYGGNKWKHILIKIVASTGDTVWNKVIRDYGNNGAGGRFNFNDIVFDANGDFYISGDLWNESIRKYNADGDTIWTKRIPGAFYHKGVGSFEDFFQTTITKTNDGKIYVGCAGVEGVSGTSDVLVAAIVESPSDVEYQGFSVNEYFLSQNFPNPFNPITNIQFSIPQSSFVTLEVFNELGEQIDVLVSEDLSAGTYNYDWNASSLTSGIYFYRLQTANFVKSKKMIYLK